MRTTIDLTPDACHLAKAIARDRNQSLGKVVSEFILRPVTPETPAPTHSPAGFPLFRCGRPITSEDVQSLISEDEDSN